MSLTGLSLFEILVSLILISLILTGLVSLFVAGKTHIRHSRYRMTAGELGRFFLDPLQMDVRQDAWGSNCLSSNPTSGCPASQSLDITYSFIPTIDDVAGTNLRRVTLNINWTEP